MAFAIAVLGLKKSRGQNPQTEEFIDEWDCAIGWLPILLTENAMTNRGQTNAIENLTHEVVKEKDAVVAASANQTSAILGIGELAIRLQSVMANKTGVNLLEVK